MTIYQNLIAGSGFLQGATGATGPAANTTITTYQFVATAGQSVFSGADSNSNSLTYTVNGIVVTLNGVVLKNTNEYTATNGTSITLVSAASAGDELNIYTFPAYNIANALTPAQANTIYLGLNGGTISGNVNFANGSNFSVPVGNTAQRPAASPGYIRYNTDLNTLESANATAWANVGSGSASSGGVSWQTVKSTNFVATAGSAYPINTTTANVTVTLPASPTAGQFIQLVDYARTWSSNNVILYPNGANISGMNANVSLTASGQGVALVYIDATQGWISYSQGAALGQYTATILTVAGGGGGGAIMVTTPGGGGGGAGGLLYTTGVMLNPGTQYSIIVGAGGVTSGTSTGNGSNSVSPINTAIGGGGGGTWGAPTYNYGQNGGSGGGGSYASSGGSGTSGQGNNGGAGNTSAQTGGGGGGANAAGGNASSGGSGSGGAGLAYSITGSSVYYAGGGGGGTGYQGAGAGAGGVGGGTNGGASGSSASNGTNGTGGGAGGIGGYPSSYTGGGATGGSGIVVISYLGSQRALGGTISSSGGYTIHTFTTSGTFIA